MRTAGATAGAGATNQPSKPHQTRFELEEEQRLIRRARDYSEMQKKKTVKWFASHGTPIPTADDINMIHEQRENEAARKAAVARAEDRARTSVHRDSLVAVPSSSHPLYQTDPETPTFVTTAANGINGRKVLHKSFANLVWNVLLRNRAEQRLKRATKSLHADGSIAGGNPAGRRSVIQGTVPILSVLEMPDFMPSLESAQATAYGNAEEPSSTNVELFEKKPLKVPFEYQLKGYQQQKFPDHHYSNADPQEEVQILPAGPAEVAEEAPAGCSETVPKIETFSQPIVTLETFPVQSFPFARFDPEAGLVQGTQLQPDSDGGFAPPHHTVNYNHAVPSETRPFDIIEEVVVREPLPSHLKTALAEDDLSDTDDDEDLPVTHPKGLGDITSWLPQFKNDASASPPAGEKGESDATAHVDPLAFDEKDMHRIGNQPVNVVAQERMLASRQWMGDIIAQLPRPQQLPF